MAREIDLNLPSLDSLFTTQEDRDDQGREKVLDIDISIIDGFEGHPFRVADDESMIRLSESIQEHGIQTPAIVRQKEDGRYELISGHRRKRACEIAGIAALPCIVRQMTRDEAVIFMVDSNLQRERILPSEKAFSYKMKLEAMKRQGKRTDLTSDPVGRKWIGKESVEIVADESGDSRNQVRRFIRLTELIPPVLEMVDMGRIAFRPAVELSYLPKEMQQSLYSVMETEESTPSLAQAIKMKEFAQDGRLSEDVILSIMSEQKPNQIEHFKLPRKRLDKFFPPGTSRQAVEDTIVQALEMYLRKEKAVEKPRGRGDAR